MQVRAAPPAPGAGDILNHVNILLSKVYRLMQVRAAPLLPRLSDLFGRAGDPREARRDLYFRK